MSNSEAPFAATMELHIQNKKILLTARGDTERDLQIGWAALAENASSLIDSFNLLAAASATAPIMNGSPAPAPTPAASADPWGTPPPMPAVTGPTCAHGPRNAVSKVGEKGPWKAWMCNAPKGSPKCDPIWVNKQSPEWNTFPG
jgi:hypothetical protein